MNKPIKIPSTVPATILLLLLTAVGGCQFVPEPAMKKMNLFAKDDTPPLPDRMMAIWSDTVLHQPQQPGVRGFGGRIYFYGEEPDPIEVDGGLVVYAFDSEDLSANATKPEKKYVFTVDQFAEHMSYTDMGPSYSVWLPWDEVGGPNRQLSLIARFEGRRGGVVLSKPTVKLLPGVGKYGKPSEQAAAGSPSRTVVPAVAQQPQTEPDGSRIAQVSHLSESKLRPEDSSRLPPSSRRPSMTIDLPPSFRRHLMGPRTSQAADPRATAPQRKKEPLEADSDEPTGRSHDDAPINANDPSAADGRYNFQDRWPRHSFRTRGTPETLSLDAGDALRRPAGWMEPLQDTPRGVGRRNSAASR